MYTGAAPASGYVAIYAICNPSTGVSALLGVNAAAAAAPQVYGGANMPAGYTMLTCPCPAFSFATALISLVKRLTFPTFGMTSDIVLPASSVCCVPV